MPVLDWIGKAAVVRHHQDVPYRLLEPVPALSCEPDGAASGNLIVQGDNLHALKALLPRYAGQVKCIYIDPPYNTGNEGWVYNDNVNSPEIRRWLGEVVGKEGETLDRARSLALHDVPAARPAAPVPPRRRGDLRFDRRIRTCGPRTADG
jgi:hypothetical protein